MAAAQRTRRSPLFSAIVSKIASPIVLAAILACGSSAAAEDGGLDRERAAFREVYPAAERGDWGPAREHESLLRRYVLWPDLRAAYLRAHLDDSAAEILKFLQEHGNSKPARELRYQLTLRLAKERRFPEYLELYRRWYAELGIPKLDCLALHADILAGNTEGVAKRGAELWLTGRSQADECDPVFDYLRGAGTIAEVMYRERFELAIAERQFSLARYLARSLDERYLDGANAWMAAQRTPEAFLLAASERTDDSRQLLYAL